MSNRTALIIISSLLGISAACRLYRCYMLNKRANEWKEMLDRELKDGALSKENISKMVEEAFEKARANQTVNAN